MRRTLALCSISAVALILVSGALLHSQEDRQKPRGGEGAGGTFVLHSPEVENGGTLPKDYTGDGTSSTLPLEWSGAPAGTKSYALIMHHIAPDGETKWYWILYNIPANVQSLPKNVTGVGTLGNNSVNRRTEYAPPHSKGPGPKTYVYTVYALSAPPQITVAPSEVNRDVLLEAMKRLILAKAEMSVVYARFTEGAEGEEARPPRDRDRGPEDREGRRGRGDDRRDGEGDRQGPPEGRGGGGRRPPPPLETALDANGDGVIDEQEIANAPEALKKLDKNGDGKLTPDEYRPPRPGGPGGPEGESGAPRDRREDRRRGGEDQQGRGEDRQGPPEDREQRGGGGRSTEQDNRPASPNSGQTVGLFLNDPRAFKGYTLFAPKHFLMTYLMDNEGRVINTWKSDYEPGQSVYLLPNGHLMHSGMIKVQGGTGGGEGGRIEDFDWDGKLVWEYDHATRDYQLHHDFRPLPNGHVLALMVERKSREEAEAAGFDPRTMRDDFLVPDAVIEIEPILPKGGRIVWEWHVWDHLIQDYDRTKPNYGKPAEHPERIWTNANGRNTPAFWNHMNSIAYNPDLDQIMLSVRGCSEIWIIDHSTTTKEAASRTGGRYGKGGDLLYRWGNPAAYGRGNKDDQMLFDQHDAHWIEPGCPGVGNVLIFNNGLNRLPPGVRDRRDLPENLVGRDWGYSSVDKIVPPVDKTGHYTLKPGVPYGPRRLKWTYVAKNPASFFAEAISGAQRLPNGNTLICDGTSGVFFEVTPGGKTVWRYVNPVVRTGPLTQGQTPGLDQRGHKWNAVFKVHRYAPDYAGLTGRDLTPKDIIPGSGPQMPERARGADDRRPPSPDREGGRPSRNKRDDDRDRRDDRRGEGRPPLPKWAELAVAFAAGAIVSPLLIKGISKLMRSRAQGGVS